MTPAFLHGFILAFGLILPLGVQNVFIFTQGAIQPRLSRVAPVVLIAGLCDTLLIGLAVGGVSVLVLKIAWVKTVLVTGGVAFLVWFGWLTWRTEPAQNQSADLDLEGPSPARPISRQIIFTLSVSLLNPHAILDTIGVIGTSSLSYYGNARVEFTLACISVSWLWFVFLASAGRLVGSADRTGKIRLVLNRLSAVIMWASAVYLVRTLG